MPDYINLKDHGYKPDAIQGGGPPNHHYTGTDNGPFIQAAINEARASRWKKHIYVPPGFAVAGPFEGKNAHEMVMFGEGIGQSVIIPNGACHGKIFFDIDGAGGIQLKDLGFGQATCSNTSIPRRIISYGRGVDQTGNASRFQRLSVYGRTTEGSFVNHGAPSSYMDNCFFYTLGDGAPAVSLKNVTDFYLNKVEQHELHVFRLKQENPNYIGYGNTVPMRIENCAEIQVIGGNIGGNGPRAIDFFGYNRNIIIEGVEIYAQDPLGQAYNGVIRNNGTLEEFTMFGCVVDGSSYVFGGPAGAIFNMMHFRGQKTLPSTGPLFAMEGPASLLNSDIYANGCSIEFPGGTIKNTNISRTSGINTAIKKGVMWTDMNDIRHFSEPFVIG